MKCINPIRIKNISPDTCQDYPFIDCACGKCAPCLLNRRQQWLFRLRKEKLAWNYCFFITLTYSDENCPNCLNKKHLQKFLKRLRAKYQFKYYAIGEYGTTTYRPHYHIILFTNSNLEIKHPFPWYEGFYTITPVNDRRLNYITHYHVRPKVPNHLKNTGIEKSFQLVSKGLGLSFLISDGNINNKYIRYIKEGGRVIADYNGVKFIVPRYYVKKLRDAGVEVTTPMFDTTLNPSQRLFAELHPNVKFDPITQLPLNYSKEDYLQHLHSCYDASKAKLKKYNHQEKL